MKFHIITVMPDLIEAGLQKGVVASAFKKGLCQLNLINPRSFTSDVHQTVDDRPFGGGDGMLMIAQPLQAALDETGQKNNIFYLSPQGQKLTDGLVKSLAQETEITLICGRYGGVDQRFLTANSIKEISIGDYVLSGGELAALVIIDALARQIPGVLGHASSAMEDSFTNQRLEAPYYTRPQNWQGLDAPPILLSGDHKKIKEYQLHVSLITTLFKRPDLLEGEKNLDFKKTIDFIKKASQEDLSPLTMGLEAAGLFVNLDLISKNSEIISPALKVCDLKNSKLKKPDLKNGGFNKSEFMNLDFKNIDSVNIDLKNNPLLQLQDEIQKLLIEKLACAKEKRK